MDEQRPRRKFWSALEWLLFVKDWGSWRRALLAYLLLMTVLGMIWAMVLAGSDLYAHPGMMWGLATIASPTSLLFFLVLLRFLQALKQPLVPLAKTVLLIPLGFFVIWVIGYALPLVFPCTASRIPARTWESHLNYFSRFCDR
jgi:hypothetical protein